MCAHHYVHPLSGCVFYVAITGIHSPLHLGPVCAVVGTIPAPCVLITVCKSVDVLGTL